MAPRSYPLALRWRVVDLLDGGRKVSEVTAGLEVSEQTIYIWRHQARIDTGIEAGVTMSEQAELAPAQRRIREFEAKLAIHRRAKELLKEKSDPNGRTH